MKNYSLHIRSADSNKDAEAICHLMQQLAREEGGQSQLTVQKLQQQIARGKPELIIIVAELAEHIIGTAIAYKGYDILSASPGLHLSDIYVIPKQRSKGIGKAILARLAAYTMSEGGEWISWTVLSTNRDAKMFYQRLGATAVEVDFMAFGVTVLKQLCQKD